ncbi:MAG: DnaB-like helicase N-terminal domain-containing protein, partial [Candidatus Nanopelagicaceae bacterium]
MAQMTNEKIESTILRNLLFNEDFYRKVVPFVKPDYFEDHHERIIYEEVWDFASKYDTVPTSEVIIINLQDRKDITEESYNSAVSTLKSFEPTPVEYNWLLDTTEKWCKDRAIYLALLES